MVLMMARPFKHPKTGVYWFRKAVPKDLQGVIGKREFTRTLKTKEPAEARTAHAKVAAEVDKHWQALRSPAESLTNKQAVALAGVFYHELTADLSDEPGSPIIWEHWLRIERDTRAAGKLEQWLGSSVDQLLTRHGLNIDADSRARLLAAISDASEQAGEHLKRNAEGDYSPDPKAERFPQWTPAPPVVPPAGVPKAAGKAALTGLLEAWWTEAKATGLKPSTHESYSTAIAGFVKYLGHDDAARVTPEDVIGFKDHRLASINPRNGKPISPRTVKGSDLSGLKAVFGWALANRKVLTNPALGVTVKVGKKSVIRSKGFTDAEATAILQATDDLKRGQEQPKTFSAKRWVPWLCAYTGARVGQVAQLRKEDVRHEAGHWVIRITPEAGTVKTDQARDVVLHPHLVEKGFPTFVQGAKPGHLFVTPHKLTRDVLGPLQGITNRLGEQARTVVKDPLVKPNHGWRHRFKTVCRNVGIDPRVMDAIQGHAPRTAGDDYGDVTVAAMALALAKFPRQGA
jgi:integrase